MECEKCGVKLNGEPKELFINKYGSLDDKYGSKKKICISCYNELLNIEDDAILGADE